MRKSLVALAMLGVTGFWGVGIADVAQALPAGQVPVYVIPYVKSYTNGIQADSLTVITITRVGGTTSCAVSVDWRKQSGALAATSTWTVAGNTAANYYVGGSVDLCSSANAFSADIANCFASPSASLASLDDGVAIVGTVGGCVGGLAVDARVIYIDPSSLQPLAIHSLKVLRPYNQGNKGD